MIRNDMPNEVRVSFVVGFTIIGAFLYLVESARARGYHDLLFSIKPWDHLSSGLILLCFYCAMRIAVPVFKHPISKANVALAIFLMIPMILVGQFIYLVGSFMIWAYS